MARTVRFAPGGLAYHVMNRAAARLKLFHVDGDYAAFERVLDESIARTNMRVCAYCVMPNHFHLVVWPEQDGSLSNFMHWLTMTHTQRYRAWHESIGEGHLYQGRFRSFPIQEDWHFLRVCRYVERNPLRAAMVDCAEQWRWSSLSPWRGKHPLSVWPVERPINWLEQVNTPEDAEDLGSLRQCLRSGQPYGAPAWTEQTARRLGVDLSARPRGRPRKSPGPSDAASLV